MTIALASFTADNFPSIIHGGLSLIVYFLPIKHWVNKRRWSKWAKVWSN